MVVFNLAYIAKRRKQQKITQQKMAEKLGFRQASTYLKYENGDYKIKAEMLPQLAEVLGCQVTKIFAS